MKQAPYKIFSTTQRSPLPHFTGTKDEVYNWLDSNMYGPDGFEVYCTETDTAQDARKFLEENNPFVPKFYRMDPKTDDVLPSGHFLKNGMRVLIESSKRRINVDGELEPWQEEQALQYNRWCTIGALEIGESFTRFIGVYDDGSKIMREHDTRTAWLVKIDSIREVEAKRDKALEKYDQVLALVSSAMIEVVHAMSDNETAASRAARVENKAEETTLRIMGLL
jgi:hypothetical protein